MAAQVPPISTNGPSRPTILLLSLDRPEYWGELYGNLVDAISAKATLQRVSRPQGASTYLANNRPSAIIVTDPAIVGQASGPRGVSSQVLQYVRSGGTAVLATLFSSSVRPNDLDRWFREEWGSPWQNGDYHRTTVSLNPSYQSERLNTGSLPQSYSQKAVFLKNVATTASVYRPSGFSTTESHVFAAAPVDTAQTPVVFAKVGEGWLGYVGDVNNEAGSQSVVLAMCGL